MAATKPMLKLSLFLLVLLLLLEGCWAQRGRAGRRNDRRRQGHTSRSPGQGTGRGGAGNWTGVTGANGTRRHMRWHNATAPPHGYRNRTSSHRTWYNTTAPPHGYRNRTSSHRTWYNATAPPHGYRNRTSSHRTWYNATAPPNGSRANRTRPYRRWWQTTPSPGHGYRGNGTNWYTQSRRPWWFRTTTLNPTSSHQTWMPWWIPRTRGTASPVYLRSTTALPWWWQTFPQTPSTSERQTWLPPWLRGFMSSRANGDFVTPPSVPSWGGIWTQTPLPSVPEDSLPTWWFDRTPWPDKHSFNGGTLAPVKVKGSQEVELWQLIVAVVGSVGATVLLIAVVFALTKVAILHCKASTRRQQPVQYGRENQVVIHAPPVEKKPFSSIASMDDTVTDGESPKPPAAPPATPPPSYRSTTGSVVA